MNRRDAEKERGERAGESERVPGKEEHFDLR